LIILIHVASFIHHAKYIIILKHTSLLRLVNEIGDPSVEQVPEEGFQLVEVRFDIYGISEETNNPTTAGKPRSKHPFPCVVQMLFTLSLMLCALSKIGIR
jgi:hypothetical protein